MSRYRMRSRVVTGAPRRTFYVQRRCLCDDGRERWVTVARSTSRSQAVAFTALSELGLEGGHDPVATSRTSSGAPG